MVRRDQNHLRKSKITSRKTVSVYNLTAHTKQQHTAAGGVQKPHTRRKPTICSVGCAEGRKWRRKKRRAAEKKQTDPPDLDWSTCPDSHYLNETNPPCFFGLPCRFSSATFSPPHMPCWRSLGSIGSEVFGPLQPRYAAVLCVLWHYKH